MMQTKKKILELLEEWEKELDDAESKKDRMKSYIPDIYKILEREKNELLRIKAIMKVYDDYYGH